MRSRVPNELTGSGMPWMFIAFAGLFGACIGSFLNVCIFRWGVEPKQSVVRPPSRCPRCGHGLAWYENVPIVSWIILRGRCRGCSLPISIQYPLIELATAIIWAWSVWRFGLSWTAASAAVFATILLGIAMTDAREYIIPHEFTYGGMGLGLLFSLADGPAGFVASLQGMIFGAGLLYLIGAIGGFLAGRDAMGGGDVAMMAMVGAFLGWESVCATIFLGSCVGVILHLISLASRKRAKEGSLEPPAPPSAEALESDPEFKSRDQLAREGYIPFGVSLAIAAALILVTDARWWLIDWVTSYAAFLGL
jgi:leader peptidase (prepilin peptidase) / N-methyltransferase